MSISVFLPVRKGSERVLNKNTRKFAEYEGGLLELKLGQLLKVESLEEIVVSTNDETCAGIADAFRTRSGKIRVEKRPDELGSSNTDLVDLIRYVPGIISSEDILWTHVTSPLCNADTYNRIIETYRISQDKEHDSLMTVHKFKNFLWDAASRKIINNKSHKKWPRTQDLAEYFEINSAVFLAPRSCYLEGERVGSNPFLFQMDKMTSLDVDYEEDFKIAEAVYERFYR